jgi:hypothetical protein
MNWTLLPKGRFTGIDWASPGATTGFDPYLIWAEADGFAGYGKAQPKWLSLAVELEPGTTVAQLKAAASTKFLHVPSVYTSDVAPVGLRFCTARVTPAFFAHIKQGGTLHGMIRRFELGMPLGPDVDDPTRAGVGPYAPAGKRLKGKVLGLIDGGLAFANANFLSREPGKRKGKARTAYFWRQDQHGMGASPESLGYGHELTAADIDTALKRYTFDGLADETAIYLHFGMGMELEKRASHGSHVLDLAGGPRTLQAQVSGPDAPPSWADADDDASRAPIVAVQLDWETIKDTSGGSMNVHVLDAIMYILSRCDTTAPIALNLSWGTLAGPHDGSSLLEAAMDQLIALRTGPLQIVLPAGNSYQSRTHANATLLKNEHATLEWQAQPGDLTHNFLELWIEPGCAGLEIEISPPGYPALPALTLGQSRLWTNSEGKAMFALIYPASVATGEHGTCALLATAPSFSFHDGVAVAPSGTWKVGITNRHDESATFDAYIERDDDIGELKTGARQSYFQDQHYDTSGNPGSFVDYPSNASLIRRSGTFNSIATGSLTVAVGGKRLSDGSWAHYSACKPDPDVARLQRPNILKVPEADAVSDENPVLTGVRAAGSRSDSAVRLRGTSDAAPQQTRRVLNEM